ncbi:hypothetical protein BV20DRAFT_1056765 [Pilatotrama ljubarskyi]|nr:hypothetical protein BV20DRAFT_1056765 [Pilatotrama ljubarskyi]
MSSTTASPYRDPSVGDLIIRTSDGVDFHVHRRRVADASSVFSDMFTHPQPAADEAKAGSKPVVEVSERSGVWSKLLPIIYVAEEPYLTLEDVRDLLEAGRKYKMPGTRSRMKTHLLRPEFLEAQPYPVYALAVTAGLEDVARVAARRTLRVASPGTAAQGFILPTDAAGRAMYKLMEYRAAACLRAVDAVKINSQSITQPLEYGSLPRWMFFDDPGVLGRMQPCDSSLCSPPVQSKSETYHYRPQPWKIRAAWLHYMRSLEKSVEHNPSGAPARGIILLEPVIKSALNCPLCSKEIFAEADRVSREFEAAIEKAISAVNLDL